MNRKTERLYLIIIILLLLTCGILAMLAFMANDNSKTARSTAPTVTSTGNNVSRTPGFIVIDKGSLTLSVMNKDGDPIFKTGIACGRVPGDKVRPGDFRTPEGIFAVKEIQNASTWSHDFNDGKGKIEGCYGNWFIRLDTPGHTGIGIHGTHDPASIGTRATEGCIRLQNDELEKLHSLVAPGMKVVIIPGSEDDADNRDPARKEL